MGENGAVLVGGGGINAPPYCVKIYCVMYFCFFVFVPLVVYPNLLSVIFSIKFFGIGIGIILGPRSLSASAQQHSNEH